MVEIDASGVSDEFPIKQLDFWLTGGRLPSLHSETGWTIGFRDTGIIAHAPTMRDAITRLAKMHEMVFLRLALNKGLDPDA